MAISSNLDLANQALALLGEMSITSLGDTTSKPSLLADEFVEQSILETLAQHEWREAIKRASIAAGSAPTFGATATFALPAGCLRVLEVNATTSADSTLPYHIEGETIVATAANVHIRYIDDIAITACGPLLQQACAVRLASKLALPLTGSQERLVAMESLFTKTIGEARARDVQEHPLTAIVIERIGVSPDTISSDLLRRFRTFAEDARKEVLRRTYQSEATALASMDTMSQDAVHALHSAKIAAALSLPSATNFEELFQLRLREAKLRALQTSALNGRVLAMVQADLVTRDISDTTLTELVTNLADDARKEVLRRTYQSEATALGSMDTLAQSAVDALHAAKIAHYLALPSLGDLETLAEKRIQTAKLRALQTSALNGRVLAMIQADLLSKDLSDTALTEIATFADEARKEVNSMTYVSEATVLGSMSTLAQECVDILHARKIATYLSLPSLADFEALFTKKIQEAKARALQTSALNGRVLAMIGADLVTKDISDTTLTELVTNLAVDARKEVLRTGLFASALEIATLSSSAGVLAGKAYSFALPSDCLSLVELASDAAGETLIDFEIIDQKIATNTTPAYLRYIKDQTVTDLDVLAQSAIDALHAAKIAHYLTLPSLANHEELYALRLRQARKAALDEADISTQVLALVGEDLLKAEINRHQIRWFRRYADEARTEILRMHRWNCATLRAILTPLTPTTGTTTYTYRYALPEDCLRVLEVNGESYEEGESLFEIESGYLYAHAPTAWIRYVADVALSTLDPLLQQAITLRHAAKIAAVTSVPSAPMLEGLAQKRLAEARQANSHVRSADNNPRHRLAARSTILRTRGYVRNPLRLEDF